jgi:predicted dehydrogenase
MTTKTGRRQFLQRGVRGGLGATLAMSGLALPRKITAASDKVVLGFIGVGGRGSFLLSMFLQRPDVEIAYICDVARERRDKAVAAVEATAGDPPKAVEDLRRVLDDRHVDGVVVATPDHWHALATVMACQAGKDVYVEKPATQNIWEGRKAVEAARKYQRVVQVGMQNRSSTYGASARELVKSGKLGDVHLVRVYDMFSRQRFQKAPDGTAPDGFNWDLWLGPAAARPFNPSCRKNWDFFWDFSSGFFDEVVHQLDFARMVIDKPFPNSVLHAGGNLAFKDDVEPPDTTLATYEYDTLTLMVEQTWWTPYMVKTPESVRQSDTAYPDWYPFNGMKVEIFGTKGMMILGRHGAGMQLFDQNGQKIEQEKQTHGKMQAAHIGNYIDCIRTRKRPNADIEDGHISASLGHMANISYRVGNRKLKFDAATETFVNDAEANRYLKRAYREPWVIRDRV